MLSNIGVDALESFPHRRGGEPSNGVFQLLDTAVFPTGVGVNLGMASARRGDRRFPHRRGGEPDATRKLTPNPDVFPTGVGVNRGESPFRGQMGERFPHRRGGEPLLVGRRQTTVSFSPQAWG